MCYTPEALHCAAKQGPPALKNYGICALGKTRAKKQQNTHTETIHLCLCVCVFVFVHVCVCMCVCVCFKIVNRHIYIYTCPVQYFCLPCGERQLQNARAHQSKNKSKASWHAALLSAQNSVCIPDVFSILIISTACSWRNQSHNKL